MEFFKLVSCYSVVNEGFQRGTSGEEKWSLEVSAE
jgi:hypothetical protein